MICAQIVQVRFRGGHKQIAVRLVSGRMASEFLEAIQNRTRIEPHPDIDIGCELSSYAAHALDGGTETPPGFALQHQNDLTPRLGQTLRDAGADDSLADYAYINRVWHEVMLACPTAHAQ